jgi:uncharacterized repeat protein (TIGR03803 family)
MNVMGMVGTGIADDNQASSKRSGRARWAARLLLASCMLAAAARADDESVLWSFGATANDPQYPYYGSLVVGTGESAANYLWGMTSQGGASGLGTIFKIALDGNLSVVHEFTSATDGQFPNWGLMQASDGNFYGVAASGGTLSGGGGGQGTVFRLTPGGSYTVLHVFGGSDGGTPLCTLVEGAGNYLYGTTTDGGANGQGTVFKISLDGTSFVSLHSFDITDGEAPSAGLVLGSDGNFYGETGEGGDLGNNGSYGTVFSITSAGVFTLLYSFDTYSESPTGSLIQGANGDFYFYGGSHNSEQYGKIYEFNPNTNDLSILYAFSGPDGNDPYDGSLLLASDGNLYGVTRFGGAYNDGALFRLTTAGALTVLHSFDYNGSDGVDAEAGVAQAGDGNLYGMTEGGGAHAAGTIYRYNLALPTVSPTTLNFGDVDLGNTSAPKSVKLTVSALGPLSFGAPAFTGANSSDFAVTSNTCTGTLAAGKSCRISLVFTPSQPASTAESASLVVDNSTGDDLASVALSGASTAAVAVSPGSINFGDIAVGSSSPVKSVTLSNHQSVAVSVGLGVSGSGSGFAMSATTCGATLAAFKSCTVSLTFAPGSLGAASGTLTVTDSPDSASPHSIALSGTGTTQTTVAPASINFGDIAVGSTSPVKSVTLSNHQSVAVNLGLGVSGSGFALSTTTCGATLAAFKSCTVSLTFAPGSLGAASGTLTATDSPDSESPHSIALSGAGTTQTTVAPASIHFGDIAVGSTSAAKNITITNHQSSALSISLPAGIGGPEAGDFATPATTCTATLAAFNSCTISVNFAPAATGAASATLTLSDSPDSESPHSIALIGTGD